MRGPIFLVSLVVLYSLVNLLTGQPLPNFSPLAALFFCSAVWFHGKSRWLIPVLGWLTISVVSASVHGYSLIDGTLATGLAYLLIFGLGSLFRGAQSKWRLFAVSLTAPVLFFVVTNLASFAVDPRYAKSLLGLSQALWTGIPGEGFPPSWVFFRNSLVANGLFSFGFFALAMASPKRTASAPALDSKPEPA